MHYILLDNKHLVIALVFFLADDIDLALLLILNTLRNQDVLDKFQEICPLGIFLTEFVVAYIRSNFHQVMRDMIMIVVS